MIEFLESFAKQYKIAIKKDAVGNILMSKPATPGKENLPTVVLQSHMDMVCEKAFDRSVLDIIGREDRQFGGYTDAIVGTQSRTVGAKPVSVDDCFDRIVVEIMCGSIILFADHVHVGLLFGE